MNTVRNLLQVKGYDVWSIGPDATVFEALRRMESKGIGALLVMDGDRLAGIVSERDYARKVILRGKHSNDTRICEIMTERVFTIHPDQTLDECMDLMTANSIRHLPVVEEDRVIGVISIMDVVRAIIHRQRIEISRTEPRSYGP